MAGCGNCTLAREPPRSTRSLASRLSEIGKLEEDCPAMSNVATEIRTPQPSTPDAVQASFRDMEDFAAAVSCDVTQLSPGGEADVASLELASGHLVAFRSSFDLIARGTRPPGLVTFMITEQSLPGFALNGHAGRSECLWAYGPGAEAYGATPRGSELTLITIPVTRLGGGGNSGEGALGPRCQNLTPPPAVRASVSRIVASAFDLGLREPVTLHDHRRRMHIESDLVECLSLALQMDESGAGRRTDRALVSREVVLRAVDDQLESRRGEPVRVTELSAICGVSLRTLHNTFQAAHGLSAMEYVRLYRLKAVRRVLARADPFETTVSETALRWGFWHPGAFSVLYRKTFGERPSETLRRRR